MDGTRRRWTRAVSAVIVALAALLVPVLAAEPAFADTATALKSGGTTYTDNAGTTHGLAFVGHRKCFQSYCDASHDGRDVVIGLNGVYTESTKYVVFCYLDSRNATTISCTTTQVQNPANIQFDDASADAATGAIATLGENYYAGLVCVGDPSQSNPNWVNTGATNACGIDKPQGSDGYGTPRAQDMGHKAETGDTGTLPGQQADGTVDPVDCVAKEIGDRTIWNGGQFDPVGIVLAPIKCAFLWATTPPTAMIPDLVKTQTDLWNGTQLGKTVNAVNFYSSFSVGNSCNGITVPLHLLKIPQTDLSDFQLLSTCNDNRLSDIAGLVKLGLTLSVLLGGAIACIRIISSFIKGPEAPAVAQHASDFDDVLMGR